MKITEITAFEKDHLEVARKLLFLLVPEQSDIKEADFRALLASENSHLFFLFDDTTIAGMVSVGIYKSPSGIRAWIEDVVVDIPYRGMGLGRMLVQHAIDFAKSQRAEWLLLTTNPKRIAANNLYQSLGFELRETNVYRMRL